MTHPDPQDPSAPGPIPGDRGELDIGAALREAEDLERQAAQVARSKEPEPDAEPEPSKDPWGLPEPYYEPGSDRDSDLASAGFGEDSIERERRLHAHMAETRALLVEQRRRRALWEGIGVLVAARTLGDPLDFGPWSVLGAVLCGAITGWFWGQHKSGRIGSVLLGLPFLAAHVLVFSVLQGEGPRGTYFGISTVGGFVLFACLAGMFGVARESSD